MSPVVVIKNGLLQTVPYPGNSESQKQAERYLDETARVSTDNFLKTSRPIPSSMLTRSCALPSEHPTHITSQDIPEAACTHPSVHALTSASEQHGLQNWNDRVDQSSYLNLPRVTARDPSHGNIHACSDTRRRQYQMPLTSATTNGERTIATYTPFSLQDTAPIKSGLPDINKGGAQ